MEQIMEHSGFVGNDAECVFDVHGVQVFEGGAMTRFTRMCLSVVVVVLAMVIGAIAAVVAVIVLRPGHIGVVALFPLTFAYVSYLSGRLGLLYVWRSL